MRIRAVILDDEPVIRRMLWTLCDERGYEVFTFRDPCVCPLHTIRKCPCPDGTICADIIISDVTMLNVSGLDFIEDLLNK